MKINRIKNAFTLAEVLVSLTVIGILSATLVPVLYNNMAKESMVMLKKAYQVTGKAVSEMINDYDKYPDEDKGFTYISETKSTPATTGADFCTNFASYFNKTYYNSANCATEYGTKPEPFMRTSDGMKWYFIYNKDYLTTDEQYGYKIIVDVNGTKGPNCQLSTLGHCTSGGNFAVGDGHTCVEAVGAGCDHPDTFIISINRKGRISAASSYWAGNAGQEPYDAKILETPTKLSW